MSYYYLRQDLEFAEKIRDMSELVMIDSGAHSFQKGTKVKWEDYTHSYAAFIREFDRSNVVGYFEMDVDNIIGYENVLKLREILHKESGHPRRKSYPFGIRTGEFKSSRKCARRILGASSL